MRLNNHLRLNVLSTKGAIVLDKLLPKLLTALSAVNDPDETLARVLGLLEAIAGRTVYLSLLVERPDALTQLLRLTSASPWLCDLLARSPILLDELLDSRSLYEPLTKPALQSALSLQLSGETYDDLERFNDGVARV
ncbi:hypothetical protein [Methylocucumis oryzae]|uniref:hypothetical protein n=1 Tax=Methylocucumis oryzae TaxID=1632867 RepID=UPI0030840A9B